MAIIKIGNTGGSVGSNLASAQPSSTDTSVGRSLSEAGRQIQNAGLQAIQQNISFIEKANASIESNIYNRVLTESIIEYNKSYDERVNNLMDEDGNPNYNRLQGDVNSLGQRISEKALSRINGNENLKNRISDALVKYTANKTIQAGDIARKKHIEFSQATLFTSVDDITKLATQDDVDSIDFYINDIQDIVSKATADGVITPMQARSIMENSRQNIANSVYNTMIADNPEEALKLLKGLDNEDLMITQEERLRFEARAERGIQIKEQQQIELERLAQRTQNAEQRVLISKLEYEMESESPAIMSEKIHRLFEEGKLTEENKWKLLKKASGKKVSNDNLDMDFTKIDNSIKFGVVDGSISPSSWEKKYAQDVAMFTDQESGQPPSLTAKTNIVAKYTAPVKSFQKELEHNLLQGTPQQMAEASRSYVLLAQSNPIVLQGMKDDMIDKAEHLNFLLTNTGIDPAQAVAQVKRYQDVPEEVRANRIREFNKLEELSGEELKGTVRKQLGYDKGFLEFFKKDVELSNDFLESFKELARLSYARTGDMDVALTSATNQMKRVYGVSEINGKREIMAYPPERYIPQDKLKEMFEALSVLKGEGDFKLVSDLMTITNPSDLSYSFVQEMETEDGDIIEVPVLDDDTGELLRYRVNK